jgi:hypothetical protein
VPVLGRSGLRKRIPAAVALRHPCPPAGGDQLQGRQAAMA